MKFLEAILSNDVTWHEHINYITFRSWGKIYVMRKLKCLHGRDFLTLSLPNATVVEFTVHCQTRLQSRFNGTGDSCLFLTVTKDANLCSLFQNVTGHDNMKTEDYAIFCTRMNFTKIFVMSLDFAEIKTTKTCPRE